MKENRRISRVALIIEISVGLTLLPRWIPALMLAEGNPMPAEWMSWWIPLSAFFNAGMAITEAAAIAYVFYVWHHTHGREAKRLLTLIGLMLVSFSVVLAPYVASSISRLTIQEVLISASQNIPALIWGTAVVLSTGFTVMAVGVAQGSSFEEGKENIELCWCGYAFDGDKDKENHLEMHENEYFEYETPTSALDGIKQKYEEKRNKVLPPYPTVLDVAKVRKEG